jgi:3-methyladenine DNA glycosylase AlkD
MNNEILQKLFSLKDIGYKEFNSSLIPSVNKDTVIGVRIPLLKGYAKEIKSSLLAKEFLSNLPHSYFEENNLHAFLIAEIKDYKECIERVNEFLPYIDNWATCDSFKPKCFAKNKDKLIVEIKNWLKSDKEYTVRFGVLMLLTHFLDGDFKEEYLRVVANINISTYYVDMMCAWYFATALAKQWNSAVKYLEDNVLKEFIHNKTIRKAIESYRITTDQKKFLIKLKKIKKEKQKWTTKFYLV